MLPFQHPQYPLFYFILFYFILFYFIDGNKTHLTLWSLETNFLNSIYIFLLNINFKNLTIYKDIGKI